MSPILNGEFSDPRLRASSPAPLPGGVKVFSSYPKIYVQFDPG